MVTDRHCIYKREVVLENKLRQNNIEYEQLKARLIDAVSIDEALKDIFVKGFAEPRLRQKLDWKMRKMKDIRNLKFTI